MRPGTSAGTGLPAGGGGGENNSLADECEGGTSGRCVKITLVPPTRWVGNVSVGLGTFLLNPPPPERAQTPLFHSGINELPGEPASVRPRYPQATSALQPTMEKKTEVQTSPAALMFKPKPQDKDVT